MKSDKYTRMLEEDNRALREAGDELVSAAFKVASEYDGVHRLMLASAKWATARANEGGRRERFGEDAK